ncbi:MAG: hypothetical protein WBA12_07995 [Catalinimonas sp.]
MLTTPVWAQRDAAEPGAPNTSWHFAASDHTYLTPRWQAGVLLPTMGEAVAVTHLRYDLKTRRVEVRTADGVRTYDPTVLSGFRVYESPESVRTFVRTFNPGHLGERLVFMELVYDGARPVLVHRRLLQKPTRPRSDALRTHGRTVVSPELYTLDARDCPVRLPRSRRAARYFFADLHTKVEGYARHHGLRLRRHEDAVQLMAYYNDLQSERAAR